MSMCRAVAWSSLVLLLLPLAQSRPMQPSERALAVQPILDMNTYKTSAANSSEPLISAASELEADSSHPADIPTWVPDEGNSFGDARAGLNNDSAPVVSSPDNSSLADSLGRSWLQSIASTFPSLATVIGRNRIVGGDPVTELRQAATAQQPQPAQPIIPEYRIVGGAAVPIPRYPYMVSFRDAQNRHYCGGSLIHPRAVITAAHCVSGSNAPTALLPTVQIGRLYSTTPETGYISARCSRLVVHQYWSMNGGQGDLALCVLPEDVTTISPVAVAREDLQDTNTAFTVIGWGSTQEGAGNSDTLQAVTVDLIDLGTCNATYEGRLTTRQLCAGAEEGGRDACQGDSGGPLIIAGSDASQDVQYGLVSWGQGCAEAGKPGVYTRLSAYVPWINSQLQTYVGSGLPDGRSPATGDPATQTTGSSTNSQASACACTQDGRSGNMAVTEIGCKQHSISANDSMYYCYTQQGTGCLSASSSTLYGGRAGWRTCDPATDNPAQASATPVQAFDGPNTQITPAPTPATSAAPTIFSQLASAVLSLIG